MVVATRIEWTTTPAVALSEVQRLAQSAEQECVEEVRLQPGPARRVTWRRHACRGPPLDLMRARAEAGPRWTASSSQNYTARSPMWPLPLLAPWLEL